MILYCSIKRQQTISEFITSVQTFALRISRGLAIRGGKFGPFIACSNYPDCKYTRKFAKPGGSDGTDTGPETMGNDPDSRLEVTTRSGRFGPYIQLGDGKEAKRSSIPKDIPGED